MGRQALPEPATGLMGDEQLARVTEPQSESGFRHDAARARPRFLATLCLFHYLVWKVRSQQSPQSCQEGQVSLSHVKASGTGRFFTNVFHLSFYSYFLI